MEENKLLQNKMKTLSEIEKINIEEQEEILFTIYDKLITLNYDITDQLEKMKQNYGEELIEKFDTRRIQELLDIEIKKDENSQIAFENFNKKEFENKEDIKRIIEKFKKLEEEDDDKSCSFFICCNRGNNSVKKYSQV